MKIIALSLCLVSCLAALASALLACCPAPPRGKVVINADQTVIIIWDAETKTQHFIRQADFRTEADDFGFLVPTPSQPELAEAGDGAFPYLADLTATEVHKKIHPIVLGCATRHM